jgi:TRAP-type C4-dicarboxylate transport system permease small subunit
VSNDDADANGGTVEKESDVPPTRRVSAAAMEPPVRPSAAVLDPGPQNYPDDSPLSAKVRRLDHLVGVAEQITLFSLLAMIVLVATVQAFATKIFSHSFLWSFDVVRAGTFAIAMLGAAFASHHISHLSMDIVSRRLSPRNRLALRVVLGLFTVFATYLLLQSGLHLRSQVATEGGTHTIPPHLIAALIPLGSAMIIFHTVMRTVIDIDYLRRGKLPPEKAMSGH